MPECHKTPVWKILSLLYYYYCYYCHFTEQQNEFSRDSKAAQDCLVMDEDKGTKLRYTASQKLKNMFSKEAIVHYERYKNQYRFAEPQQ